MTKNFREESLRVLSYDTQSVFQFCGSVGILGQFCWTHWNHTSAKQRHSASRIQSTFWDSKRRMKATNLNLGTLTSYEVLSLCWYDSGHVVIDGNETESLSKSPSKHFFHLCVLLVEKKFPTTKIILLILSAKLFWVSSIQLMGLNAKLTLKFLKFIIIVLRFQVGILWNPRSIRGLQWWGFKIHCRNITFSQERGYKLSIWFGDPVVW